MSTHDYRSKRMSRAEALKRIRKVMADEEPVIVFRDHAFEEMAEDGLEQQDVINILSSPDSRIEEEGEPNKYGNYAYRVKTNKYCVVVVFFKNADGLTVITVWEIKRGKR